MTRVTRVGSILPGLSGLTFKAAILFIFSIFLFVGFQNPALSQSKKPRLKGIESAFYPEAGSPVEVTSIRSLLEIDPFGAPIASKVYITYKNIAQKPIAAVKFRIRYTNAAGKDLGTFHAPDGTSLGVSPGTSRSNKWRKEGGLHPDISSFKVRVLQAKFTDGSQWQSLRLKQLKQKRAQSQGGGAVGGQQVPDAFRPSQ